MRKALQVVSQWGYQATRSAKVYEYSLTLLKKEAVDLVAKLGWQTQKR
jgi:hypothetical protein